MTKTLKFFVKYTVPLKNVFGKEQLLFEFRRTYSRLIEMGSKNLRTEFYWGNFRLDKKWPLSPPQIISNQAYPKADINSQRKAGQFNEDF